MTSATAPKSSTQKLLEQRERGYYINLSKLTKKELSAFIVKYLGSVDLSELRGFEPLSSELGHSPLKSTSSKIEVEFKPCTDSYMGSEGFNMDTHVTRLHSGVLKMITTYVRFETNEVTTEWRVAHDDWKEKCYIQSTLEEIFVLRRPRGRTPAHYNLISVEYFREKIPHKDEYKISWVKAVQVTPDKFFNHFGKKAGRRAKEMISEISSSYYRTRESLRSKVQSAEEAYFKWNSLSESLTSDR